MSLFISVEANRHDTDTQHNQKQSPTNVRSLDQAIRKSSFFVGSRKNSFGQKTAPAPHAAKRPPDLSSPNGWR